MDKPADVVLMNGFEDDFVPQGRTFTAKRKKARAAMLNLSLIHISSGVGYDELAMVNGKLAQVVKIMGDEVTLQVFEGTEGIPTNAEAVSYTHLVDHGRQIHHEIRT